MPLFMKDDNKGDKKSKGINKNAVKKINHKEYINFFTKANKAWNEKNTK